MISSFFVKLVKDTAWSLERVQTMTSESETDANRCLRISWCQWKLKLWPGKFQVAPRLVWHNSCTLSVVMVQVVRDTRIPPSWRNSIHSIVNETWPTYISKTESLIFPSNGSSACTIQPTSTPKTMWEYERRKVTKPKVARIWWFKIPPLCSKGGTDFCAHLWPPGSWGIYKFRKKS